MPQNYDDQELRRLQDDAARRVRDMQDRSRRTVQQSQDPARSSASVPAQGRGGHSGTARSERYQMQGFPRSGTASHGGASRGGPSRREESAPADRREHSPAASERRSNGGLLSQLFGGGGLGGKGIGGKGFDLSNLINLKGFKLDGDLSLIIMVVLLVAGEEVDELLLMALIYIML